VIRSALKVLGLPADGLRHGVRREVYLAPLAENWKEYLRGEINDIQGFDRPADDIAEYYRTRWAIPRALRQTNFTNWRKDAMRLSHQLPNTQIQFSLSSAFDVAKFVKEITTDAWNVAGVTAVAHPIAADITGESVSGVLGAGRAHVTSITFQNIQVEVADTTWSTGERDIQAIDRKDSPPTVDSLIRRLRIGIHNTPELENLVFAELRVALPDDQGRAVVRKLSQNKIEALLNLKLTEVLPAKRNVVVGTREELLGDSSRRRTELCALFPRDDQRTPIDIWILTRLLPFLSLSGPKMIENVPTQKVAAGPQGQAGQAGRSRRRSSRPASQSRRQTRKPK
jgi:hypothetical protein